MNIVFDFGAVLFTWQPRVLLRQIFPQRVRTDDDAADLSHQVFGHADWHEFDRGVLGMNDVALRTAARLQLPLAATQQLVTGIGEHLVPIDGTVAVLQELRRHRQTQDAAGGLYYLSNMPVPYARFLQQRHDFLSCFDGGLFSGDVQLIKPDPAFYLALQQRYQLMPANTLFIDDLKSNVCAAQALGWQGIHYESPQQLRAQLAALGLWDA